MKQYKKGCFYLFLVFLGVLKMNAQEVLTLQQAISIALENNYDVKIKANQLKIDSTNVSSGNAGMLPRLTASVVDNNNLQNSTQTRQDGTVNSLSNAKNNSLNYGVALDWTIFDGFKMFAKYDQLKAFQKFGEAQLKLELLTKVSQVNAIYYDLVQQQQQVAALDTTLTISTQRLQLAQNRFSIGKASKLEVLNAQVDLNTDKVNIAQKLLQYQNTKVALNQLLARKTEINFKVNSEIIVDKKLVLNELTTLAEKQNPQLTAQVINKQIAELQLKQVKADRYPSVRLTTGYQFQDTQSSLGFVTQSATRGLNYGFGASLNIFDGFAQNRNETTAKIEIENATIALEQQQLNLHSQLTVAYQTYLTYLDLMELEATNEAIAKQNLSITIAKFRIGTITTLEFRTAQLNEINAKVRYTAAQYQAKLAEIKLKELAGKLDL